MQPHTLHMVEKVEEGSTIGLPTTDLQPSCSGGSTLLCGPRRVISGAFSPSLCGTCGAHALAFVLSSSRWFGLASLHCLFP